MFSSFTQPTSVAFGAAGRNILSGPGLFTVNLSLFKNFKIHERYTIQLRAETFNLTNTPQFSNPSASLTSSTYGYVTGTIGSGTGVNGAGGGRALQLGVKVSFQDAHFPLGYSLPRSRLGVRGSRPKKALVRRRREGACGSLSAAHADLFNCQGSEPSNG